MFRANPAWPYSSPEDVVHRQLSSARLFAEQIFPVLYAVGVMADHAPAPILLAEDTGFARGDRNRLAVRHSHVSLGDMRGIRHVAGHNDPQFNRLHGAAAALFGLLLPVADYGLPSDAIG